MKRLLLPVVGEPSELRVEGARFHYLARVLRCEAGDALEVFDGAGHAFDARITALESDHALLTLGARRASTATRPLLLLQGLPKGDKLELILQKTTELGVASIVPLALERCVVKLAPPKAQERLSRWTRIAEEAARQCGRADVPSVEPLRSLNEALDALPPSSQVLILDEAERDLRLSRGFLALDTQVPVALLVGPEGGLTREEVARVKERGGVSVSLGETILRTETAGLAALAVLRHLDGAFG